MMQSSQHIAFLGIGLMGSRMVTRLLQAGFKVGVWNRTVSACDALVAQGAHRLDLQQLDDYAVIMLCLADDTAVEQVIDQCLPYLTLHHTIIDFSSLSVQKTLSLAQMVQQKGAIWVDAPVSGGVQGAEQGQLVVFAGGDLHCIEGLMPCFAPLAQRVTRMGTVGSGQATKICNQLIVASTSALIAEAVALARVAGVDTSMLADALGGGFADSRPLQILAPRMASYSFEPLQWKVATLYKDLGHALQLADTHKLTLTVASRAYQHMQQHVQHYAQADLSTLILAVEDQ